MVDTPLAAALPNPQKNGTKNEGDKIAKKIKINKSILPP